jgi:prevent-host-death family protein
MRNKKAFMRIVNIYEAKTHFSKLVDAVIHGNEVIIAMAGKPVAKLGPINKKPERKFGILKGKIKIASDFDAPLEDEFLADFEA